MKRIHTIGAALAAATVVPLGSLALPAPAQATASYLEAQCTISTPFGGYRGSLRVYYNSSSTHDFFNRLNWYSYGPGQGTNNKIFIRLRKHRTGPDQTLKSWAINTRKGSGGRSINIAVNRRDRVWFDFKFRFDIPHASTLDCLKMYRTRSI
ncbi:hypothetical protein SAMN05444920_102180 [Nonomuraea solani]|uniref:Uncharacterized protein n=1 Tax=Nonomuraea solani TaxID=1144553 RepID=A0A1H5Y888_9ACTN|nr:hypothetical protein [Nonomuraea solani]SEG20279.1 hypothetical protein SAMN05444920_102180 [Nonomuraea solani]